MKELQNKDILICILEDDTYYETKDTKADLGLSQAILLGLMKRYTQFEYEI